MEFHSLEISGNFSDPEESDWYEARTWVRYVGFYTILGLVNAFGNIVVVAATLTDRLLDTCRFYVIVRFMCLCRALNSVQFFVVGTFNCLHLLGIMSINQPIFVCQIIYFWLVHGLTLELLLLLFLAVDRVMAITVPFRYSLWTPRQAGVACVVLYGLSLTTKLLSVFFIVDGTEVAPCTSVHSTSSATASFYCHALDHVLMAALILVQLSLTIYVKFRSTHRPTSAGVALVSSSRDEKLTRLLRNQVLLHCSLLVVPRTVIMLSRLIKNSVGESWLLFFGGIALTVDIFVNTLALLLSKDVRKSCRQLVGIQPGSVA